MWQNGLEHGFWASNAGTLCLSFLTCWVGVMAVPVGIEGDDAYKVLRTGIGTVRALQNLVNFPFLSKWI